MSQKVAAQMDYCKGWEARCRDNPAFAWLNEYELSFDWGDMRTGPHTPWHAEDFTFIKSTGEAVTGGSAGWAALVGAYAPFTSYFHEPFFYISWETANGWELFGCANLFAQLPVPGEKDKTDLQGRKWDVMGPGAFAFELVKDPAGPQGMKLKKWQLFSDPMPMAAEMIKRGMVTPEQLMSMH